MAKLLVRAIVLMVFTNIFAGEKSYGRIDLGGWGITRDIASGCAPTNFTDFIETAGSTAKRIEPRDCSILKIATPIFSWPQPQDLMPGTGYSIHLSAQSPSTNHFDYTTSAKVPRIFIAKSLPAGRYNWAVSYRNKLNAVVTSQARHFEVPTGTLFAIPSGEQFANAVLNKSHPRIQPNEGTNPQNKVSWANVIARSRARGYSAAFNYFFLTQLNNSVGFKLPATPITRNQALDLKTAIVNLAYGYNLWGDVAYFNKAKILLDGVVNYPLHSAVDADADDQVNRELYSMIATSLDLLQWKLSESANIPLRNKMVAVLLQRLDLFNFDGLNTYPYDSHQLTGVIYAIESMMYAAGTPGLQTDGGKKLLIDLWETAITTVGTWGGSSDAGWANAGGYGWYAADVYVRLLATTKLMANLDLSGWPALSNFGYNQLYFSAPLNSIRQQFGDEADVTNHYVNYADNTFRLFALATGKPEYEWYWRVRGDVAVNDKWMWNPLHFMLIASTATAPAFAKWDTSLLPRSILFEDAGLVAMHSNPGDANRTSVFFRSSRFGSFNHSHADQNAFTFVSKGKDMLISGGVYDTYSTDYHAIITRATRFKNTLTFDGGIGQAEPAEIPTGPGAPLNDTLQFAGKIINYTDDGTWMVTTGDATAAYRGMNPKVGRPVAFLKYAYRTVAYNRQQGVVIIYDWAQSATPRKWELNFNTLKSNNPKLEANATIKLENATTSACLKVWNNTANYFDAFKDGWEGLLPKADLGRAIDPEVHVRFNVRDKSTEFTAVTVINEGCKNIPVNVAFSGSAATATVNGSAITLSGRTVKTP